MWVPLTALGYAQAHAAAQALVGARVSAVLSSDQTRAVSTAKVIALRLGVPLELTAELREQALGELEGRSYDELVPEAVAEGAAISEIRWGGGESVADVHTRLSGFVASRERSWLDEVVLVSHGDTLRILLAVLAGRSHREVDWADEFANGEVRTVGLG